LSTPPLTRDHRPSPGETEHGIDFDEAFRRMFDQRFALLYRYLHRLTGDTALADDVAQEAFVRLYDRAKMPDSPVAWLITVANNLVRDEYRRTERRSRLLSIRLEPPDPAPSADAEVLLNERTLQVRRVLATLSLRHRQALLLRHEGHSYLEIAEIIGVAPGSVGTTLVRATAAFVAAYGRMNEASE
jgi:RNA polymerase sigma-70 factor (ECF subfamily)